MLTKELFNSLFPVKGLTGARALRKYNLVRDRDKLIDALSRILPRYEINNYRRVTAFFGNCGIETDYFKTTSEYATGWDYDIAYNPTKAHSLGNFKKGDGPKYKGGGLTQTTGGYNYAAVQKAIGAALGVDLVKNPELLRSNIEIAVESACIFWRDNNLNSFADRGLFKELSAIVNRGDKNKTPLHWEKRRELYELCKSRVPKNLTLGVIKPVLVPAPVPAPLEPVVLTPTGDPQPTVAAAADNASPAVAVAAETEKTEVKKFAEKYLKHCPSDSVKNILSIIAVRAAGTITTVWTMGLSGQILLIASGVALLGFTAYALYYYSPRIFGWIQDIGDSVLPSDAQ